MGHRPDPKINPLSLQLIEVETVRQEQASKEYEAIVPLLGEHLETETLLTPVATESDPIDAADFPPGSSCILLVDSESNEFH